MADTTTQVADLTESMRHLSASSSDDAKQPAAVGKPAAALSPPTPAGEPGYMSGYALPSQPYAAPAAASAPGTPPTQSLGHHQQQVGYDYGISAPGSPGMGMGLATAAASALVTNELGEPIVSMRVLLTSKAAGVCIGVRGATMDALRKHSGAKAGVSKLIEGVNDRVLNLVGTVTELSKAVLFVATTLAQHPVTGNGDSTAAAASSSSSSATMTTGAAANQSTTLRLLVPNAVMGSLIGRGGTHIKHMQEAHGTRMVTAKECLPVSTERTVDVTGTPLAIANTAGEIAALVADEWDRVVQTTRLYDPRVRVPSVGYQFAAAMQQHMESGAGAGAGAGHHQRAATTTGAATATSSSASGTPQLGSMSHTQFGYSGAARMRAPSAPHTAVAQQQPLMHAVSAGGDFPGYVPQQQQQQQQHAFPPAGRRASTVSGSQPPLTGTPATAPAVASSTVPLHDYVTQSVGIPDGLVGSLIGRGGARISEIRATSGARILIDRVANALGDRMFQLSGSRASVEAALRMIYQQLAAEKERRVLAAQQEEEDEEADAVAAEGEAGAAEPAGVSESAEADQAADA